MKGWAVMSQACNSEAGELLASRRKTWRWSSGDGLGTAIGNNRNRIYSGTVCIAIEITRITKGVAENLDGEQC
jgi:hypothetical protein